MMQIPELTEVLKRKQGKTVWSSLYDGGYFADCLQCIKSEYRIE